MCLSYDLKVKLNKNDSLGYYAKTDLLLSLFRILPAGFPKTFSNNILHRLSPNPICSGIRLHVICLIKKTLNLKHCRLASRIVFFLLHLFPKVKYIVDKKNKI